MKILGYTYTVIEDGDVAAIGGLGRQRARSQEIQLAADQHPEQKLSTLLHEIIEALNYHLMLNLSESKIAALEAGMYQVLVDNGVDLRPLLASPNNGFHADRASGPDNSGDLSETRPAGEP